MAVAGIGSNSDQTMYHATPANPRSHSLPSNSSSDTILPITTDILSTSSRPNLILANTVNQLIEKVSSLNVSLTSALSNITNKNKKINKLERKIKSLEEELVYQKIEINALNQYGRREHLEFVGIKESIKQESLETYIIELIKKIGIDTISNRDIVAVHRLGKYKRGKNRNVIVKFLNRKDTRIVYKSRNKLKRLPERIFVIENLCPDHKGIFNRLYKLYKQEEIYDVWTVNGHVFAVFDEESVEIQVESDIDYYLRKRDRVVAEAEAEDEEEETSDEEKENDRNSPVRPESPSATRVTTYLAAVSNITTPLNSTNDSDLTSIILAEEEEDSNDTPENSISALNSGNINPVVEKSFITTRRSKDVTKSQDPPSQPCTSSNCDSRMVSERIVNLNNIDDPLEWCRNPQNVYVGRPSKKLPGVSGIWGNPNKLPLNPTEEDRINAVTKFKEYLTNPKNNLLGKLDSLRGKNLGCYCMPDLCHAEAIIEVGELRRRSNIKGYASTPSSIQKFKNFLNKSR